MLMVLLHSVSEKTTLCERNKEKQYMGTHGGSHTMVLLLMIAFHSCFHELYKLIHVFVFSKTKSYLAETEN